MTTNSSTASTSSTKCRHFIELYARRYRKPFTYLDLRNEGKRLHTDFKYGTLRNRMMRLVKDRIIFKFPSENPARFMWKKYAEKDPRFRKLMTNDIHPERDNNFVKFDFVKFVESLEWEKLCYVHDVRVEFDVIGATGVSTGAGWRWSPRSHSWLRVFDRLEFPMTVQLYDTARVQVAVRCSLKPVPFNFDGLVRLNAVLGELKGCLNWDGVCNVADWEVTSWHYGKDSSEVSGPAFNVTFSTWSKTLARIYFKRELGRVRLEEVQHPHQTMQDLIERVLYDEEQGRNYTSRN